MSSSGRKKKKKPEGEDVTDINDIKHSEETYSSKDRELANIDEKTMSPKISRSVTTMEEVVVEPTSPKVRRSFSLQKSFKKLGRKIATPLASANSSIMNNAGGISLGNNLFEGLKHGQSNTTKKITEFDGFASSSFNKNRSKQVNSDGDERYDLKGQLVYFEKKTPP